MQYTFDKDGVLSETVFPETAGFGIQIPSNGIELEELINKEGYIWVYKDGEPIQLKDNRGTYYTKETGEKVDYQELGEVPSTLTSKEPTSIYDKWDGKKWVKDEEKEKEALRASIVPITKRQAMLQLNEIGLYDDLIEFINQSENKKLKIEFEYSSSFERDSPVIIGMSQQFSLTDEQVDNLFAEAAKL